MAEMNRCREPQKTGTQETLREELSRVNKELRRAEELFDVVTEDTLIEACTYRIQTLLTYRTYLLRTARRQAEQPGTHCPVSTTTKKEDIMGVWIIAGVVLILALLVRWRHALRGWLLSAAGGLGVLCLVQAIGALLPVNLFTVAVCGILGLPGAISLLVCNLMW